MTVTKEMQQPQKEYLDLAPIVRYWVLIVAIVGGIYWAATTHRKLEEQSQTIMHIGNEGSKIKDRQTQMQIEQTEMKGDVKEIKGDVNDIKQILTGGK